MASEWESLETIRMEIQTTKAWKAMQTVKRAKPSDRSHSSASSYSASV